MTQPCHGARAGRSRPGRHCGAFRAVGPHVAGPGEPPVHLPWISDTSTAMAAEPALPACGGGRVVSRGLDSASGAARQHWLLRNAGAVICACAALPVGRVPLGPVRRSCDSTLPVGFTLRSCTGRPVDSTSSRGIDHWPTGVRGRRPDPARIRPDWTSPPRPGPNSRANMEPTWGQTGHIKKYLE